MKAQQIIEAIKSELGEEAEPKQILEALEDGQALLAIGVTDNDQEEVETAHNEISEMMKKLTLINARIENFGAGDVIAINFRLGLDEMHEVYLNPDRSIDFESFEYPDDEDREKIETWVTRWVKEHHNEISKLISDSVFGSNDFVSDKQLFGAWLGGWGIFKFVGSDGEIAVAVCNESDGELRIDRKAKTFSNEAEYNEWYEKMEGDEHYGDANIVNRAIFDIQGEEY